MPEPPSNEYQVQFLLSFQRVLDEGLFTATYKYALLLALADIAVEDGDNTGGALTVSVSRIAEKFIANYWRHAVPYVPQGTSEGGILRQTRAIKLRS